MARKQGSKSVEVTFCKLPLSLVSTGLKQRPISLQRSDQRWASLFGPIAPSLDAWQGAKGGSGVEILMLPDRLEGR